VRILFSFTGGHGHLEPLLPIARAASAGSHDVAVAGGHRQLEALAGAGLRTFPLGPRPTAAPRTRLPLLEVDVERERNDVRERFVRRHARNRVSQAAPLLREWRPDAVVCDEMDYGTLLAAELADLPYAAVLVNASGSMITSDVVAEPLDELRAEHGLPRVPLEAMLARHLVLSPFPPSLPEPGLALPEQAFPFRAVTVERSDGKPPWPVARPDRPSVYFTLGTEFNVESGDLFARVLAGLRELPLNVVATLGNDIDPVELGPHPAHVHVARFIPQTQVLRHCAAVVSHGGSGSILGALAHGLPQVLIAMGADQPLNAARCSELGLAVTLDPVSATPDDVCAAVTAVVGDPSYKHAAERMRAEIEALPEPAQAVTALEDTVARFRG
jgi:UDP:flavonoid glycosyltransferase YjiC (YdhE family)